MLSILTDFILMLLLNNYGYLNTTEFLNTFGKCTIADIFKSKFTIAITTCILFSVYSINIYYHQRQEVLINWGETFLYL
jgi:hypothetical protein